MSKIPTNPAMVQPNSNSNDFHDLKRLEAVLTICYPRIKSIAYKGIIDQILKRSSVPFFDPSSSLRDKIVTWYYQKIMGGLDQKYEVDKVCSSKKAKMEEYIRYTDDALEADAFSIENIVAKKFISTLIKKSGPNLAYESERTILTSLTKNAASSLATFDEYKPLALISVKDFQTKINTTWNSLLSFEPDISNPLSVTSILEFLKEVFDRSNGNP